MEPFTTSSCSSIYLPNGGWFGGFNCFQSLWRGGFMATQAQIGELEVGLLRMFLSVVDHGSIGRAATAADMTQPAVSQQMLRLERVIGHTLLARGRNGITLT